MQQLLPARDGFASICHLLFLFFFSCAWWQGLVPSLFAILSVVASRLHPFSFVFASPSDPSPHSPPVRHCGILNMLHAFWFCWLRLGFACLFSVSVHFRPFTSPFVSILFLLLRFFSSTGMHSHVGFSLAYLKDHVFFFVSTYMTTWLLGRCCPNMVFLFLFTLRACFSQQLNFSSCLVDAGVLMRVATYNLIV